MPALGESGACPSGNFEKLHCLRLNPAEGIFSNLSLFNVPIDTGTQNLSACLFMLSSIAEIIY